MRFERGNFGADTVDGRVLSVLVYTQPQMAARLLCEHMRQPGFDHILAEQVMPYLDRIKNDYMVREVVETGMASEDSCVRLAFADQIGMVARRDRNDAYSLLSAACLEDQSAMPDLLRAGLQAVQRDAPEEYDFLVEKGLHEMRKELRPGALERRQRINRRFRRALEAMEQ